MVIKGNTRNLESSSCAEKGLASGLQMFSTEIILTGAAAKCPNSTVPLPP